jgi:hypothetical protein
MTLRIHRGENHHYYPSEEHYLFADLTVQAHWLLRWFRILLIICAQSVHPLWSTFPAVGALLDWLGSMSSCLLESFCAVNVFTIPQLFENKSLRTYIGYFEIMSFCNERLCWGSILPPAQRTESKWNCHPVSETNTTLLKAEVYVRQGPHIYCVQVWLTYSKYLRPKVLHAWTRLQPIQVTSHSSCKQGNISYLKQLPRITL